MSLFRIILLAVSFHAPSAIAQSSRTFFCTPDYGLCPTPHCVCTSAVPTPSVFTAFTTVGASSVSPYQWTWTGPAELYTAKSVGDPCPYEHEADAGPVVWASPAPCDGRTWYYGCDHSLQLTPATCTTGKTTQTSTALPATITPAPLSLPHLPTLGPVVPSSECRPLIIHRAIYNDPDNIAGCGCKTLTPGELPGGRFFPTSAHVFQGTETSCDAATATLPPLFPVWLISGDGEDGNVYINCQTWFDENPRDWNPSTNACKGATATVLLTAPCDTTKSDGHTLCTCMGSFSRSWTSSTFTTTATIDDCGRGGHFTVHKTFTMP